MSGGESGAPAVAGAFLWANVKVFGKSENFNINLLTNSAFCDIMIADIR